MSIHDNRAGRINCLLIAGGVWHDIDHARLELLKLLSEDERFRVRVFEDYENLVALEEANNKVSFFKGVKIFIVFKYSHSKALVL